MKLIHYFNTLYAKPLSLFYVLCISIGTVYTTIFFTPIFTNFAPFYAFPFIGWLTIIFIFGIQYWPFIWIPAIVLGYLQGDPFIIVVTCATLLTITITGATHFYYKLYKNHITFDSIKDQLYAVGFVLLTGLVTCMIFVGLQSIQHKESLLYFGTFFPQTYFYAMTRAFFLTPIALVLQFPPKFKLKSKETLELCVYLSFTAYIGWYLFSPVNEYTASLFTHGYVMFPMIFLIGIRLGSIGVLLCLAVTYLMARLWAVETSPFYDQTINRVNLLQTFLLFLSVTGILTVFILNALKQKSTALNLANSLFKGIIELIPIPMMLIKNVNQRGSTPSRSIHFINRSFTNLTGYGDADFRNQTEWFELAYPDSAYRAELEEKWVLSFKNCIEFSAPFKPLEAWICCKNGDKKYVQWSAIIVQDHYVIYAHELTQQKAHEDSLKIASSLYEAIGDSVVITDTYNHILAVNPSFKQTTGFSDADVLNQGITNILFDNPFNSVFKDMWGELDSSERWEGQVTLQLKDGTLVTKFLSVYVTQSKTAGNSQRIWLFSDVTPHKMTRAIIYKQANYDALTGLPNRRLMNERLEQAITKAEINNTGFALVYLDIDNFKDINDTMGHDIGDQVLVAVSKLFTENLRSSDMVARLGGDEFTFIIDLIKDRNSIELILNNLFNKFENPIPIENRMHHISLSAGVAIYPADAVNSRGMLMRADQAMYAAKSAGKDGHHFFNQTMQQNADKKVNILSEIRQGLKNHEFELLYQPIVNLTTGKVYKAEALIRWRLPDGTIRLPGEFLRIAEETGVIIPIGEWVFNSVLKLLTQLKDTQPDFSIAINVSPVQFNSRQDFSGRWVNDIKAAGLNPGALCLEITEQLMLKMSPPVQNRINHLQSAGIEFSVDDFGTGYSSLAKLKTMQFDYIKMDKIFIDSIVGPSSDVSLAQAVITMANGLQLKTVAEGIETVEQLEALSKLGCQFGQGYLLYSPLSEEKLIEIIKMERAACV